MGQFSEIHIQGTTGPISFKCGMQGHAYGGNKISKFDRNQPSGYIDMGVENGELPVLVNNTLVRHMAFLAADTQSCVLIRHVDCSIRVYVHIILL